MEEGGFSHRRITKILRIRFEESHPNRNDMEEIELFLNKDSSLNSFLEAYKYQHARMTEGGKEIQRKIKDKQQERKSLEIEDSLQRQATFIH